MNHFFTNSLQPTIQIETKISYSLIRSFQFWQSSVIFSFKKFPSRLFKSIKWWNVGDHFLKRHTNFTLNRDFDKLFLLKITQKPSQLNLRFSLDFPAFPFYFFIKLKPTERRLWLIDGFSVVMEWNLFWCGKLFSSCDLQQMKFLVFCLFSPFSLSKNIEKPHSTHFIVDFTSTKVASWSRKVPSFFIARKRPPDCLHFSSQVASLWR